MRGLALVACLLLPAGAATAFQGMVPSGSLDTAIDPVGPVHPYHTWETLTMELQELVRDHADIARLHSAGKSSLGFDLWVVEVADFMDPQRLPLEQREVVWLDGGTHANEQLGMMLAYLWVKFLLTQYEGNETAEWIVEHRHTYIMPMLNPDGNHLDSRNNARQVNINRNYPVGWTPDEQRPGPYPMSEPETQAVVQWVRAVRPDYFNSFHTGTDLMLYPLGYAEEPAKDDKMFRRICDQMGETDPEFCGPVYSTIYPAAGIAVDTAYVEAGASAWTYEVAGEQSMYLSLDDPRLTLDRYWNGVLHAFLNVEKYGAHLRLADLELLDDGRGQVLVEALVENDGYGDLTWAEVTLSLPNEQARSLRIAGLASGEGQRVRFAVPRGAEPEPGALDIGFRYPKRLVEASPLAHAIQSIPVLLRDGRLVAEVVPLGATASEEQRMVSGLEAALTLAVLAMAATAVRRKRA